MSPGAAWPELTGIIERRELAAFLRQTCPAGPLNPPLASPAHRVPLSQVPLLSEENRWDAASWHRIKLPASIEGIAAMTQDGHGGLWLLADANLPQQYLYHYSDGWTKQAVRSPSGYHMITLHGMTWIPGTTRVWAVGGALKHRRVAVIARYGQPSRR